MPAIPGARLNHQKCEPGAYLRCGTHLYLVLGTEKASNGLRVEDALTGMELMLTTTQVANAVFVRGPDIPACPDCLPDQIKSD